MKQSNPASVLLAILGRIESLVHFLIAIFIP
jgi:hypothetical protein